MTAKKRTFDSLTVGEILPYIGEACVYGAAHLAFCAVNDGTNDVHNWKLDASKATSTSFLWLNEYVAKIKHIRFSNKVDELREKEFQSFIGDPASYNELNNNLKDHPLGYIFPMQQILASGLVRKKNSIYTSLELKLTPENISEVSNQTYDLNSHTFEVERGTGLLISSLYNCTKYRYHGVLYTVVRRDPSSDEIEVSVTLTNTEGDTINPGNLKFKNHYDLLLSLANYQKSILKETMVRTPYGEMSQYEYMTRFMGMAE